MYIIRYFEHDNVLFEVSLVFSFSSNIDEVLGQYFFMIKFHKHKKDYKALKSTTDLRFIDLKFIYKRFINLKVIDIRFINLKFIHTKFIKLKKLIRLFG